jgi:hypothetical protein
VSRLPTTSDWSFTCVIIAKRAEVTFAVLIDAP